MRTRSQSRNSNRQQQQVNPTFVEPFNLVEPIENQAPPVVTMDDTRTMAQLLEAPTVGYEDAIVVPEITADNFELKHGLLTLVQNKQFFGHDKEDPHAHIRYFNKITSTMKFPNVPTTPPYTPQHNKVFERRNHTLLDMVRSMMNLTTLSLSFWGYALESATHILNMVPTKKVDKTPYELWYGKVPNLSYLKILRCEALVKRDMPDKLQQRSIKYVEFLEKDLISQDVEGFKLPQEEVIPVRRSARTHRAPNRLCLNVEVDEHSLGDLNKPTNYKAAMLDPESNKWLDAMNVEILQSVKSYLGKYFAIKDLEEAAFILGIKIYRDRSKQLFGLSQSAYMDKILKRYSIDNSKRGNIPMQERLDLNKTQGASTPREVKRMKNVSYPLDVGSIMYAVRCIRPDVAFAQNITSHFQQNPGEPHWTAVKTILKYLRYTKDMLLVYGGNPEAETSSGLLSLDVRFETDRDDIKSQT
ncbi:retrotransposon protein, putative, ty1-copia subclass [Tanacetum coccineum]|uniref:Retrotransposon protein, putative, ty1-copia subclass n=1 Tax=Tanacetum coccineum TaxID=301880 RepID=A0ABQ5EG01_9ASTR